MILRKISLFFFCFFLTASVLSAQGKLNLSMKAGPLFGEVLFQSKNTEIKKVDGSAQDGNGTVAVAFSVPIAKKFWLGAEVGINKLEELVKVDFVFDPQNIRSHFGRYRINQA
jgi:hypothetical protein